MKLVPLGELIRPARVVRAGDSTYPLLSMTMHEGLVLQESRFKKRIASADLHTYRVVKRGQLVVGFPIDEGVLDFQEQYPAGIVSPAYGVWDVTHDTQVDRRYLKRALRSPRSFAYYKAKLRGSTARRRSLPASAFLALPIPLPPLTEQRRIAAILDHADALRAKRRHVLVHLAELEQSVFLAMFVSDRELKPISDLCELVVDCVNRTAPVAARVTPYKMLRTTNIRNGAVDTSNVQYVERDVFERWNRRAAPRDGDVILTREAPVGEAAVLRSDDQVFLGQRLMLYRVDPSALTSDYLAACFRSPVLQEQFHRLGSGSTVKHLPLPACRSFLIPVAPISDQRAFSDRVAAIAQLRSGVQAQSKAEAQLFASLQSRAFDGRL